MARTESFGRGRIAESILDTTSVPFTLKVSNVPVEDNQFITIDPDTTSEEIFFYTTKTWTSGEAWTLNITGRGYNVNDETQDSGNQNQHDENAEYKLALNHIIINDKVDKKLNNIVESEIKFVSTTEHGLVVNNMTTAERDAIVAENGNIIYNEDTNVLQQFIGWGWSDIGSTWVADASETVAGKVEMATQAEYDAKTTVGWTGAFLVPQMDQLPITATETTEWLTERATDAEALAWVDTTRYINSKQLWDVRTVSFLQTTRASDAATWVESIAHGLWFTPSRVEIVGMHTNPASDPTNSFHSHGYSDGTSNVCTFIRQVGWSGTPNYASWNDASNAVLFSAWNSASDTDTQTATITFDSTNIDISWIFTNQWVPSITMSFTIVVHG